MVLGRRQKKAISFLPHFINRLGATTYIKMMEYVGKNKYKYQIQDHEIVFEYLDKKGLHIYRNLINENSIMYDGKSIESLKFNGNREAFIDVGAHYGIFSVIVGVLNESLDMYCFEPNNYNRQMLTHQLKLNGVKADIRPEVVTDVAGRKPFYQVSGVGGEGHSTHKQKNAERVEKNAISISDFIDKESIYKPFIKIDAEGEEQKIIKDLISINGVDIAGLVEIHPDKLDSTESEEKILELLKKSGFTLEKIISGPRPEYYFKRPCVPCC